jgi:O-antigen/teichoic acid export membrane protein
VIKDSIYTLLARSFIIVGKLVYSIFINRTLGPTLKGVFELIQLAPDTLARFGNFGFDQANTYFSGRKPGTIPQLVGNAWFMTLVFSIPAIALGVGYMLLPANRKIFDYAPQWVGLLALVVIPISVLDMLLEGILYGENRIWVRNVHAVLRIVSALVYMGIFVVGLQWAVQGAVYGYILISLTLFTFVIFVLRRFHKPAGAGWSGALAKESWMFGRFTWGANFASYLFYNVDRWLINALAAGSPDEVLAQVGLYGTAVNVIVNIWIIPDAIQTALLPKITQKGESERKKLVPPSLRAVTFLVLLAMILLALIARPALDFLYNRPDRPWDFTEAFIPLMLLMPGIFTLSLAKVFTADFFSRGKPQYAMWVSITSLVLNVGINFILIPSSWYIGTLPISGMNGAAIASSISYTFSFLMFLYFYIRESGERSRDIFIPKKSDFEMIWMYVRAAWQKVGVDRTIDREGGM